MIDDLPEAELRRLSLSLNRLQERGDWDIDALRLEIGELLALEQDFELPGFELPEIEALILSQEAEAPDPADDLSRATGPGLPAVTRPGDVWRLGDHQVIYGSAGDLALHLSATGLGPVDAVFTDPPYNVRINGHVRSPGAGFAEFAEASGEMPEAGFTTFLVETLGPAVAALKPGGVIFACMDWRHIGEMTAAFRTLDLQMLNLCVWVKDSPGMGSLPRGERHRRRHILGSRPSGLRSALPRGERLCRPE